MIIKSIEVQNFRNYEYQNMDFDESTNILYGDNAQGKTNILEAVYMSGTGKSHKGSRDGELINFDCDEAHIKTVIMKNNIDYRIDMHIRKNKSKGIAVNGVPIKKSSELYGMVNMIFFSPEDLNIIKSGPSSRRKFMDMELCQLDKIYVSNLIRYNRALEQRNSLLKEISYNPSLRDTLDIWNENLINYGTEIIKRRRNFVEKLNSIIGKINGNLTGNRENLRLVYEESVNEKEYREILNENIEKDLKYKMTGYGPHRDDISFLNGQTDLRKYGSQGQQRTTALSLKLAEIELVRESTGENPILLLDDVLSELDGKRQNYLLNSIEGVQTIITCTGLDEFINNRFNINRIFKVTEGHVNKEN